MPPAHRTPRHSRLAKLTYFSAWFGFDSGTLGDPATTMCCIWPNMFSIFAKEKNICIYIHTYVYAYMYMFDLVSILLTSFASFLLALSTRHPASSCLFVTQGSNRISLNNKFHFLLCCFAKARSAVTPKRTQLAPNSLTN